MILAQQKILEIQKVLADFSCPTSGELNTVGFFSLLKSLKQKLQTDGRISSNIDFNICFKESDEVYFEILLDSFLAFNQCKTADELSKRLDSLLDDLFNLPIVSQNLKPYYFLTFLMVMATFYLSYVLFTFLFPTIAAIAASFLTAHFVLTMSLTIISAFLTFLLVKRAGDVLDENSSRLDRRIELTQLLQTAPTMIRFSQPSQLLEAVGATLPSPPVEVPAAIPPRL